MLTPIAGERLAGSHLLAFPGSAGRRILCNIAVARRATGRHAGLPGPPSVPEFRTRPAAPRRRAGRIRSRHDVEGHRPDFPVKPGGIEALDVEIQWHDSAALDELITPVLSVLACPEASPHPAPPCGRGMECAISETSPSPALCTGRRDGEQVFGDIMDGLIRTQLAPVVHRRDPRALRSDRHESGGAARVGGPCGPTGASVSASCSRRRLGQIEGADVMGAEQDIKQPSHRRTQRNPSWAKARPSLSGRLRSSPTSWSTRPTIASGP